MVARGIAVQPWPRSWPTALAPLAQREFRFVWTGYLISYVEDQFQLVALAVLALDLTGRAAVLGGVLTLEAVPRTFLLLAGGVLADRISPGKVMLVTNVVQGSNVTALTALAVTHHLATRMRSWPASPSRSTCPRPRPSSPTSCRSSRCAARSR